MKWEIVFSVAILTVVPSSDLTLSPGLNSPDTVFTNSWFFAEYWPEAGPSTTPNAPLSKPKIYLPSSKELGSKSSSSKILVKNCGSK